MKSVVGKVDYSGLANDYMKYRPSYNKEIVNIIVNSVKENRALIKAVDIGAGTGIFTKCLADASIKRIAAVEPNDDMRKAGIQFLGEEVKFLNGRAENTGIKNANFNLVTMASSFHWSKTYDALKEFDRLLTPDGIFSALWNPRLTDRSVCESEIQTLLSQKYGVTSRVSSGLSGITLELHEILNNCGIFSSVVYAEAIDVVQRSREEYIGAWRSVYDIQTQLGREKFSEFIKDVEKIISTYDCIEVHYLTRAWIARKKK